VERKNENLVVGLQSSNEGHVRSDTILKEKRYKGKKGLALAANGIFKLTNSRKNSKHSRVNKRTRRCKFKKGRKHMCEA